MERAPSGDDDDDDCDDGYDTSVSYSHHQWEGSKNITAIYISLSNGMTTIVLAVIASSKFVE